MAHRNAADRDCNEGSITISDCSFASVLGQLCSAVSVSYRSGCPFTGVDMLILVGVPMLLGFSELALTSLEQRLFGEWTKRKGAK
jgi:hypothetical protein